MAEHVALATGVGHRCDVMDGADLVVGQLQVDDSGVVCDAGHDLIGVDAAGAVHAYDGAGATVGLPAHRRVLDRRHHAVAPSVTTGGSPAGHGDRLRRPRGEDHLAATCVEHVGDLLAGGLHGVAGDHALVVDPSRISDDAGERLGHGSGRLGAQRRRGGVVEVVTGHDGRTGSGGSGFQIVTSVLQTESPMGSEDRILAVVLP